MEFITGQDNALLSKICLRHTDNLDPPDPNVPPFHPSSFPSLSGSTTTSYGNSASQGSVSTHHTISSTMAERLASGLSSIEGLYDLLSSNISSTKNEPT